MQKYKIPKILIIAGSDSSGGAGIQADIKTITALGGYAATAITALTAQNTTGVASVQPIEPAFCKAEITTLAGSTMPSSNILAYLSSLAL